MSIPDGLHTFARSRGVDLAHVAGGVPLVTARDPHAPTATVMFCLRAGVLYEPCQQWGVSHFLEHILMRGTERFPTLFDITRRVEGIGGRVSAYSTRDVTAYWVKTPPGQEHVALEVLTQALFRPTLRPEFIAAERAIIRQERLRERNNPAAFSSQMVEGLLLLPDPISRHPIGEHDDLERIGPETLRAFLAQSYHRGNLLVAAAGNLRTDLGRMLDEALAQSGAGTHAEPAPFKISSQLCDQPVVIHASPHREQVYLAMGWRFPIASRRELLTWRVLNTLLGSGYTSLLNECLRERESLTYVCSTALNAYGGTGIFKMHMAVADRDLDRVLDHVDRIVMDVATGHLGRDRFDDAVVRHAAGVIFRCEDSLDVARLLGHSLLRDDEVFSFSDYFGELEDLRPEEAAALVQRFLVPLNRRLLLHTSSPRARGLFPEAALVEAGPPLESVARGGDPGPEGAVRSATPASSETRSVGKDA